MKVSIVLPVYNDAGRLPSAVENALSQAGAEVELVLVDDGSTDGSAEVVKAAAAKDPRVVAVLQPENGGVSLARRAGVEAARGEWIWFVDSDDEWPVFACAAMLAAAADAASSGREAQVVLARAQLTPPSGVPRLLSSPSTGTLDNREALRALLRGEVTGHLWNKLVRRDLLLGLEFPLARVQSDLALMARILGAATTVACIETVVYHHGKRPGSIITSRHRRVQSLQIVEDVVLEVARRNGFGEDDVDAAYFRLRYVALSGLKDALSGAYDDEASRVLVRAVRARIGTRELALLTRRRDKRVFLALLAHAPRPLQLRLLRRW
ncbi:glycosyltransferase family 2 protein [Kineococcus gynurae]|uniref:Glycosyltransferase family 2 protein n=1 Tax=Kineococcus gynurae TaxID=452979 RepID=A0ABV5LNQ0_9ACTN